MSEHTLSGVDLTNGKRVNLNFTSGDLLGTGDLFDTTKIVEDIRKNKKEKEKSNIEKVDTFVKKVEKESPYETLTDAFGGIEKLPAEFKPIQGTTKDFNLLELIGDQTPVVVNPKYKIKGLKENEEVRVLPYSDPKDPKYFIVDKRAPGIAGLGSIFGGAIDLITGQRTDLDRLGKEFGAKPKLIDLKDPANYELSKIETDLVNQELVNKGIDTVEEDATSGVDKATTESIEQQKKQTKFDRGERLKDALQTAGVNIATMPIYTRILEDAAKRRLELDKAMLGAREMMPSNIQNIMLSKQAQKQMASSAFAEELKAVADQQDAATKFAGLGMQRPFGQPNPTSFRV